MSGERDSGSERPGPPDVREPTPAEKVRALPLVSVALGSMALGFCLVYFVCRPEGADRSATSRPLAAPEAGTTAPSAAAGSAAELRTDVDAGTPAPPPPAPSSAADAGGAAPVPPPPPAADAGGVAPPPPPPPPPPAVPSGLTLDRVDVRKCAGADGVELQRDKCGRVRGIELFMARAEPTTAECFEKAFADVPRPSRIAVTLDVDFGAASRRVSVAGADEARQQAFRAFKDCLAENLGQPEYARIDHPQQTYRFVFLYKYGP
ncbi:MAG: hypothetical protein JXB32_06095 [Deltaproteobacteria bacterium]|nr:hypothetical protein [Deltaproteobacteria bacterium]